MQTSEMHNTNAESAKDTEIAPGPIVERAAQPGTERAANADRDSGITENRAESFAGKKIRGKRGKNHRARTEADAEKNNIDVKQPGLAGVAGESLTRRRRLSSSRC